MDCNACGCVCPSGTTICTTSGSCVTNRSCPAGTSWDPCTDTCGTPYVLLSPSATQNGFVKVSGDLTLTAGNLHLDQAVGAGQGDVYLPNGKTVRVDGAGTTSLSFANATGTGLDVNFPAATKLCFGATCRNSWPSSTDFDPTYLNVGGDAMTGLLTLNGGLRMASGAGAGKVLTSDASGNGTWQTPAFVGGSGTAGYLPKFTSSTALGNSVASDTGAGLSVAGTAALGGYGLSVANNGQGGGIDVSTNSGLNGIPAMRVSNLGAGAGLEVNGGSAGNGAFIKGAGGNVALEVASYNYPGASSIGTVMQVRRGAGSGVAPGVGEGVMIGFPLQSDSSGSFTGGGGIGSVVSSLSPWKTDLFFETNTSASNSEKMRLTADGRLGIGTAAPGAMLTMNGGSAALGLSATASGQYSLAAGYGPTASGSYSIALGDRSTATNNTAVAIGAQADATSYYGVAIGNYVSATGGNGSIAIGGGIDVSRKMNNNVGASIGLGYGSTVPTLVVTSAPNAAGTYGKVGIGTSSPGALLDIQGYPNNSAIKLAGSYIGDNWDGTLHVQSGGSVVRFDGGDTVVVDNNLQLGGVSRGSWPSLATTSQYCQFNAGSGAGWKTCWCPGGYQLTGWSGYNCESHGGEWECSSSAPNGTGGIQVWHDSAATAYVWATCARVN